MAAITDKEKIVSAFQRRSKLLFAYNTAGDLVLDKKGRPVRAQNSWAAAFWAGYDGLMNGPRVPARNSSSWALYAAGRDIRKKGGLTV